MHIQPLPLRNKETIVFKEEMQDDNNGKHS